jgi:hypothetical protein
VTLWTVIGGAALAVLCWTARTFLDLRTRIAVVEGRMSQVDKRCTEHKAEVVETQRHLEHLYQSQNVIGRNIIRLGAKVGCTDLEAPKE